MNSAHITKQIKELTHTPETRMLMTYEDKEGKSAALLIQLKKSNDIARMVATIKWASHNGVTITMRPV